MGVATWLCRASWAVASLWRAQSHLLYQIIPSDRSPFSARNKMANIQQNLANSTVLRTDLQRNKVAQPSSELKEQHKMAWLFTGGRDGKQKKMPHILKSHHASLSLSQQQVLLQSQSFIFNSARVSGQTNVLLISSLLLLKWGRALRSGEREPDYREWEQEIERREEGEGENGVLSEALFHLSSTH